LKWKPKIPVTVLALRVYKLPEAQEIRFRSEYGGCKSWIELEDDLGTETAEPVLGDREYASLIEALGKKIPGWVEEPGVLVN
jgi:hypothetical protein